ncbi:MAG TPA: TonB-dependent receptor, partial [Terriglobales bacterium]|nr:TonB-dependent receptor [Terriglobales bacterium]
MARRLLWITMIALAMLIAIAPMAAQETTVRGNLGGTVVDSTGAVIDDANVTVTGPLGSKVTQTDKEGHFTFPLLTPGFYSVTVAKGGFKSVTVKGSEVKTGVTTAVQVTMQPGGASETIEVSAAAVTVDTTSTAVSANLTDSFYNAVPVGRGVQSLFYISPGVATSGESSYNPSISGGSALENLYVADGVTINDQAYGGIGVVSALYGSLGTGINLSFIKEVQVKTAGFEPQYGNTTGGIVQIVTKSGGREFHGSVGGYISPQQLEATRLQIDDVRVNPQGKLLHPTNYDADAELGGYVPGFRNHIFFFGSFSPGYERQYWLAPPASGLASIYNQSQITLYRDTYNYAGKLTLKLGDKHQIESSAYGDPAHTSTG